MNELDEVLLAEENSNKEEMRRKQLTSGLKRDTKQSNPDWNSATRSLSERVLKYLINYES